MELTIPDRSRRCGEKRKGLKRFLLLMLALALLCGCRARGSGTMTNQASRSQDLLQTDGGLFFQSEDDFLYRLSDDRTTAAPLCAIEGCPHTGPECGAYDPEGDGGYGGLGFYRGRIYLIAQDQGRYALYSVDPATCQRTQELVLPEKPYAVQPDVWNAAWYFCEDTCIVTLEAGYDTGSNPTDGLKQYLFLIDLDTAKIREPFEAFLSQQEDEQFCRVSSWDYLHMADGKLYTEAAYPVRKDGLICVEYWVVEMDPSTGEVRQLFRDQGESQVIYTQAEDGKLYYVELNGNFHEYDLKTGETVEISCPENYAFAAYYDPDLIILESHPDSDIMSDLVRYSFFTRDYKLLDVLTVEDGAKPEAVTDSVVYFRDGTAPAKLRYLKRSRIGSGTLELEPVRY